jgi:DNA-binding transcriptional ArsR family regulator
VFTLARNGRLTIVNRKDKYCAVPNGIDRTLTALADPTRRWVVEQLRRGPRRAGALAEAGGLSAPALSRHLRVLRRVGLVEGRGVEHDARVRLYRLRPEPLSRLKAWLDEVQGLWTDQLEAFKAHAERRPRERRR